MKKVLLIFTLVLSFGLMTKAQTNKPKFSFKEVTHNFDNIKEEDGLATCQFDFKNVGSQPLVIHNVRASCGCTTPDWTRKPILPGGSGYIKVTYNPKGRPGTFNKTITVTSNAVSANTVLRISGNVIPRPKTLEDIYPRVMGPLRFKNTHISFTRISPDSKKTETVDFINTTDKPVKIEFSRVPKHLKIISNPTTIKPKGKGKIVATYDSGIKKDWGFVYGQVFVKLNGGKQDYKNRISFNANIQEDFASWSKEKKANAAKVEVDNKIYDFGNLKAGEKTEHTFVIKNVGKSNLIIRKVKASCGCTAVQPLKTVIAPGKSTSIKTTFNSTGKSGRQNKSVTVITNDPLASNVLLRIQGNVN